MVALFQGVATQPCTHKSQIRTGAVMPGGVKVETIVKTEIFIMLALELAINREI